MTDALQPVPTELLPALDAEALRQEGLRLIETLGADQWSDYNAHDPGVTLLETLCFSIQDAAYRCSLPIEDLLASTAVTGDEAQDQGLHSAREILTTHPVTLKDYRKLVLDVPGVRNAWIAPVSLPNPRLFIDKAKGELTFTPGTATPDPIELGGLYQVQLELDQDETVSDFDDMRFAWYPPTVPHAIGPIMLRPTLLEARFPPWHEWRRASGNTNVLSALSAKDDPWLAEHNSICEIKVTDIDVDTTDMFICNIHVIVAPDLQVLGHEPDGERGEHALEPAAPGDVSAVSPHARRTYEKRIMRVEIPLPKIAFGFHRVWKAELASVLMTSVTTDLNHPVRRYRRRLQECFRVLSKVTSTLEAHRNLCEDFLDPISVSFAEIGVATEVEIADGVDMEGVAAQFFAAARAFWKRRSPFRSLAELLHQEISAEDIFDGPALDHGFITDEALDTAEPATSVHASDMMRLLLEIEGVHAVRNLALIVDEPRSARAPDAPAAAAPRRTTPVVTSSAELSTVPRFSAEKSRLTFYKGGIPYRPTDAELKAKTAFYESLEDSGAIPPSSELDLPRLTGTLRVQGQYVSLCGDLPRAYGLKRGTPSNKEGDLQAAQSKQLRGFLQLFEQLLANYQAQLEQAGTLLSPAGGANAAYYTKQLPDWWEDSLPGGGTAAPDSFGSDAVTQAEQRAAIIDHLLARYNEDFSVYAEPSVSASDAGLVDRKLSFLRDYPRLSSERSRAANRTKNASVSTLEERLCLLLHLAPQSETQRELLLIEHILLRPQDKHDKLLTPSIEANEEPCEGCEDPYSYRMTLVLRGDLPRFLTREERARVERIVRLEAPAHILTKICWPDGTSFGGLQTKLGSWRGADAKTRSDKHRDLIASLQGVRSYYPPLTLADSSELDSTREAPPVLDFGRLDK